MKYSNVMLKDYNSWGECYEGIDAIENDPQNVVGGKEAYYSGYETKLLKGAQAKIEALERRASKFVPDEEEEDCGLFEEDQEVQEPEKVEEPKPTASGALVGFARVSTQGQDLEDQLYKLTQAGCDEIFSGKHSGKADTNKDALEQLEAYVRKGDTVLVTKLDRLGRSMSQVVTLVERLQMKGIFIREIDGNVDTSKDDPMSKAFYQMVLVFAEMERAMIQSRMDEGKAAAVRSGKHTEQSVKGGRRKSYTDEQANDVLERLGNGQSINSIAKETGLTRQTIYRIKG